MLVNQRRKSVWFLSLSSHIRRRETGSHNMSNPSRRKAGCNSSNSARQPRLSKENGKRRWVFSVDVRNTFSSTSPAAAQSQPSTFTIDLVHLQKFPTQPERIQCERVYSERPPSMEEKTNHRVCPYIYLWPVPSCHAKGNGIHLPRDETVEHTCTKIAHQNCPLFRRSQIIISK